MKQDIFFFSSQQLVLIINTKAKNIRHRKVSAYKFALYKFAEVKVTLI